MTIDLTLAVLLLAGPGAPAGREAVTQAELLVGESRRATDPAAAVGLARRALALTTEFEPTAFVAAGRKGEVVEDAFIAARAAYRRHRSRVYAAVGAGLARRGEARSAARYLRRALLLDPTPEDGLALARVLNDLGRGSEALSVALHGRATDEALDADVAAVVGRAADVAGLPSAQAEIDRHRLQTLLGAKVVLREGPFELPRGVRSSLLPSFRLEGGSLTAIYAAEASCRSCSTDLEALGRQLPAEVRVLALPPGDDQDQALRQVLALYRKPWPLLLGPDLARQLAAEPRSLLLVARDGWTVAVLAPPFGAELGRAQALLRIEDLREPRPRPGWSRRSVDRTPPAPGPGLLSDGLAPGEEEPFPPGFLAAAEAYRSGRASEALAAFTALEEKGDGWLLPPEARLNRALCLARMKRPDAARRLLLRTGDSRFEAAIDGLLERVAAGR